jgi:predicted nucleotidyltransferase
MTGAELVALLKSEAGFFASLPDLKEAILYGSALKEKELTADADLLLVPSRDLSEGEKIDLRQSVWSHFKEQIPVMLEVVTPTAELDEAALVANGVPTETVFSR